MTFFPRNKRRVLLLALAAFIAADIAFFIVFWSKYLRDRIFPRNWGVVEKGMVFRSGRIHPALIENVLAKNKIKTIISLCAGDGKSKPEDEAAAKLGVEVVYIPMPGNGISTPEKYAEAVATIVRSKKEGKPVLVHCVGGTQRTGGVIAVYRLLVKGDNPGDVHTEMVKHKWKPRGDKALVKFLNDNMDEYARLLSERGVIEKPPSPAPRMKTEGN
jgi:protein tyrosine phosphatase (PTP) superfamily phosphohydrolase (DUF442 family)